MATQYGDYDYKWNPAKRCHTYAHRDAIEKHLGRTLEAEEVVHHINGDKHDNRLENLELIKIGEHTRMHLKGTSRGACSECGAKQYAKNLCRYHYRKIYPERCYSRLENRKFSR